VKVDGLSEDALETLRIRIFVLPSESIEVIAGDEDGSILREEDPAHRVNRLTLHRAEREARPFHGEKRFSRLVCNGRK
jgi:hypothetical protein